MTREVNAADRRPDRERRQIERCAGKVGGGRRLGRQSGVRLRHALRRFDRLACTPSGERFSPSQTVKFRMSLDEEAINRPRASAQTLEQRRQGGERLAVFADLPPRITSAAARAIEAEETMSSAFRFDRRPRGPENLSHLVVGKHVIVRCDFRDTLCSALARRVQGFTEDCRHGAELTNARIGIVWNEFRPAYSHIECRRNLDGEADLSTSLRRLFECNSNLLQKVQNPLDRRQPACVDPRFRRRLRWTGSGFDPGHSNSLKDKDETGRQYRQVRNGKVFENPYPPTNSAKSRRPDAGRRWLLDRAPARADRDAGAAPQPPKPSTRIPS